MAKTAMTGTRRTMSFGIANERADSRKTTSAHSSQSVFQSSKGGKSKESHDEGHIPPIPEGKYARHFMVEHRIGKRNLEDKTEPSKQQMKNPKGN
ncbi:hypothetical protein CK203_004354 [Vitis vinifera]|uniref:Uncharacterized protein n=1 Tax=Vitis vinifera TaxID=29760 RepID=A0A438K9R5_VITVI|nr:hypothetical protein CK203_004354 [Vitis vinifera]